ncbi:MAG: hypothetical protein ACO1Q7_19045 [Gemmatimonas sp.]
MYNTCLFCNASLGTNDALEHFPVGRRLAYDEAKGRLWVICGKCSRWNLSPIETRWEAIEDAERLFRGTKIRVSTDNVGLAQLRDGTQLVRIGAPVRAEFAAWRYGDQFMRRWKKRIAGTVIVAVHSKANWSLQVLNIANSVLFDRPSTALLWMSGASASAMGAGIAVGITRQVRERRPNIAFRKADGSLIRTSSRWLDQSVLTPPTAEIDWSLALPHLSVLDERVPPARLAHDMLKQYNERKGVVTTFFGADATNAMTNILPHLNRNGARARDVQDAVGIIESAPDLATIARNLPLPPKQHYSSMGRAPVLSNVPATYRLALEMSLHETDERRALEGELKELERRWREADEIARIADNMFLRDSE